MSEIAPTLTRWLAECDRHGLQWHKPIAEEVRAITAVVAAAESVHRRYLRQWTRHQNKAEERLGKALKRLARVNARSEG